MCMRYGEAKSQRILYFSRQEGTVFTAYVLHGRRKSISVGNTMHLENHKLETAQTLVESAHSIGLNQG